MHREGTPSGVLLPLTREIPWYGTIGTHWLLRLLTLLQLVLLTKTEAIPPMIYTHFSNNITFLTIFVFLTNQTPEPSGSRWLRSTCALEVYRAKQASHCLLMYAFAILQANTPPLKNHSL